MPRKKWDRELAQKMYDSGATDREISEKVGVTVSTVSRWRKVNSLPPRGLPRAHVDSEEVRRLYDQGYSDTEIASELGISSSSVRNWRRENGELPLNKKWDQKKALLLYNEGYGDEEIAREVGTDAKKIWEWREGQGLKPAARAAAPAAEEETEPSQLEDVPLGAELEDVPLGDEAPNPALEDEFESYDGAEGEEAAEEEEAGDQDDYDETREEAGRPTVLEAALEVFWTQGYMIGELATDLNLDPDFVSAWVAENHPEDLDRPDFDTVEALELVQAGRQDREIAAELDVSPRMVTSWRRRHDYAAETPASFDEEKAGQLFSRGMYDRDIARELGGDVTKADVQAWRERNNLNLYVDNKNRQESRSRSDRVANRRSSSGNRSGYEDRSYSNNRSSGNRNSNQRYQNNFSGNYQGNSYQRDNAYSRDNGQRRTRRSADRNSYNSYDAGPRRPRNWDVDEARRLWEAGMSDADIAREVGTSPATIRSWRQQNNLRTPR